ncbi:hypothetical protein PPERSA_03200 [Pseudocohnilembus persalinus]|uniref:Uncharacterized protein n=1 Tax=Pseudocohnilembus persalinus TaxID=266149 RepID=A0A0V0QE65_PSEPJ|nr:hypothetical protein PPERSA_03200 [Pseudocohnilembus persalinus]|eukprot:KRX00467.1 hypothetical protein PPERSA_03200 [Pseudocohnilembus persalinus]
MSSIAKSEQDRVEQYYQQELKKQQQQYQKNQNPNQINMPRKQMTVQEKIERAKRKQLLQDQKLKNKMNAHLNQIEQEREQERQQQQFHNMVVQNEIIEKSKENYLKYGKNNSQQQTFKNGQVQNNSIGQISHDYPKESMQLGSDCDLIISNNNGQIQNDFQSQQSLDNRQNMPEKQVLIQEDYQQQQYINMNNNPYGFQQNNQFYQQQQNLQTPQYQQQGIPLFQVNLQNQQQYPQF